MITKELLLELSEKTDLVNFIDNYLEYKISKEENSNKILNVYCEGWGDVATNLAGKLGRFISGGGGKLGSALGQSQNIMSQAKNNFLQAYNQNKQQPHEVAQKAKEMLQKAGLLNDPTLAKSIDDVINNSKNNIKFGTTATSQLKNTDNLGISTSASDSSQQKQQSGMTVPSESKLNISFKQWMISEGISQKLYRPELKSDEIKRLELSVGDVIEMGPETKLKGKKINRISQIIEIRSKEVIARDLTRKGNPKISIPISHLHEKEELKGGRIIPREEMELKALGGKKLWVRLTPRQYAKFASSYNTSNQQIIPIEREPETSDVLKQMFSSTKDKDQQEEDPLRSLFSPDQEKPKDEVIPIFSRQKDSPLGRFIASRKAN